MVLGMAAGVANVFGGILEYWEESFDIFKFVQVTFEWIFFIIGIFKLCLSIVIKKFYKLGRVLVIDW